MRSPAEWQCSGVWTAASPSEYSVQVVANGTVMIRVTVHVEEDAADDVTEFLRDAGVARASSVISVTPCDYFRAARTGSEAQCGGQCGSAHLREDGARSRSPCEPLVVCRVLLLLIFALKHVQQAHDGTASPRPMTFFLSRTSAAIPTRQLVRQQTASIVHV